MDVLIAQDVMEQINNWFPIAKKSGTFTVKDGSLDMTGAPGIMNGQYFRVIGSAMNDGLHIFPDTGMVDETFEGEIWSLAVPKTFAKVCEDMQAWLEKHPVTASGYTSESFGGYSYSVPTNPQTGQAASVMDVFKSSLNRWRRLPCL